MAKTVLGVDDEPETRDFVAAVLEENGYQSMVASNGEEAFEIIQRDRPDLVIMDILMPKQSGIILYRKIKASDSLKSIPVIIYSGIPRRTLLRAQHALSEVEGNEVPQPEAYLEKPVTADRLVETIHRVLGWETTLIQ